MKSSMKWVLLLSGVSLLASCGGTKAGSGDSLGTSTDSAASQSIDSAGSQVVKIMFHVDSKSAEGQAYKKRIDAFNSASSVSHIKASATYVARTTGASAYETELMNKQAEGTLPDIITFDAPNCASYANSGLLWDISSLIDETTKADFLSMSLYRGHLYGLPIQESSAGFYYNKAILAKAGVDVSSYSVDSPWTYADFKAACAKIAAAGYTPADLRLDATKDETATYLLYSFGHASGGQYISDDGLTATGYLNSAAIRRGFQFLKDLVTSHYTSYAVGATDFFDGRVGFYLSSGWTIPDLDNKYPTVYPDRSSWGLLPYPSDVTSASATGSWCFGITDNGVQDKSAAIALLNYLTSAESSKAITAATGMVPARASVENTYSAGSPEDTLIQQLKKTGKARPNTVGYPKFSTVFSQIINEMKDGDLTSILNAKAASLQSELNKIAG